MVWNFLDIWNAQDFPKSINFTLLILCVLLSGCVARSYMISKERFWVAVRGNMWTVKALTWQFSMRQPPRQQRGIKRELRQARDLLVAEFLYEICLDNEDIETRTWELVTLNISSFLVCHNILFIFIPGLAVYDRNMGEFDMKRLIASAAIPDRTPVVRVLRKQRHLLLIKFVEGSC